MCDGIKREHYNSVYLYVVKSCAREIIIETPNCAMYGIIILGVRVFSLTFNIGYSMDIVTKRVRYMPVLRDRKLLAHFNNN